MNQLNSIPFGKSTITVYNKYISKGAGLSVTSWQRTVIPNCSITYQSGVTTSSGITLSTDTVNIQIPMFSNFLLPYDYQSLTNNNMEPYFTVNSGDIVVLRKVDDEIDVDLETELTILNKYGSLAHKITTPVYNFDLNSWANCKELTQPLSHIKVVC